MFIFMREMHFINDVYKDILDQFMLIYLDDILIFFEDPNQLNITFKSCCNG